MIQGGLCSGGANSVSAQPLGISGHMHPAWQKRRRKAMRKAWKKIPREINPEKEEQLRQEPLEKGDVPAMLLAAFVSLFLPVLAVVLALVGVCCLLFT